MHLVGDLPVSSGHLSSVMGKFELRPEAGLTLLMSFRRRAKPRPYLAEANSSCRPGQTISPPQACSVLGHAREGRAEGVLVALEAGRRRLV